MDLIKIKVQNSWIEICYTFTHLLLKQIEYGHIETDYLKFKIIICGTMRNAYLRNLHISIYVIKI